MRKIREVLRLRYERGCSQREIQASTGLSKGSVSDYLKRADNAGLTWEVARELSDGDVEGRLFKTVGTNEPPARVPIDFEWVHLEMRKKSVTLQLLCTEYQEAAVASGGSSLPYQYSQFCDLYSAWKSKLAIVMRQTHRAGEKAFLDYSGKKPHIVDRETGEIREVELFVMVLGASNYTYAEATYTQSAVDFVDATINGFEYFGCVPEIVVPDQLRAAVTGPDRYDPELNPTYLEMARHYEVAVIPARPRKPRDKAKVEVGVLVAQRWIIARLRHQKFYSLTELNQAIRRLLEELNTRPFQKLEGCRRTAFQSIDRPAMRGLPAQRFERGEWKKAKVNVDYHVEFKDRFYSVHCALTRTKVEVRATRHVVEIFQSNERVASHARSNGPKGTYVTNPEHMPKSHRDYGKWPPERMRNWGRSIGPNVGKVVDAISVATATLSLGIEGFRHWCAMPSVSARAARRSMRASTHDRGPPRTTRRSVVAILKRGLEQKPLPQEPPEPNSFVRHEHIRGGDYFDKETTQ